MNVIVQVLNILGSLAMFLYGMKVMSDGIQKVAGERLQKILDYMTKNRFTAVFTGLFITCVIQSSSATTVMVVSFFQLRLRRRLYVLGGRSEIQRRTRSRIELMILRSYLIGRESI